MAGDEAVVGVIPHLKHKRGFLKYESCDVVVTNHRLLIALQAQGNPKVGDDALAADRYRAMDAEAIISETPENLAIVAGEIKRIRVERGGGGDVDTSGGPDRLIVKSDDGKHVFTFGTKSITAAEAKSILKEALGEIVR